MPELFPACKILLQHIDEAKKAGIFFFENFSRFYDISPAIKHNRNENLEIGNYTLFLSLYFDVSA